MTSCETTYPAQTCYDIRKILILLLLAVAVAATAHAVMKHGEQAKLIRQCLDNGGPHSVWAAMESTNKFFQACQLNDGRYGIRIIERVKAGWRERTSFIVKDGTLTQLKEYLTARATIIEALP